MKKIVSIAQWFCTTGCLWKGYSFILLSLLLSVSRKWIPTISLWKLLSVVSPSLIHIFLHSTILPSVNDPGFIWISFFFFNFHVDWVSVSSSQAIDITKLILQLETFLYLKLGSHIGSPVLVDLLKKLYTEKWTLNQASGCNCFLLFTACVNWQINISVLQFSYL